MPESQSPENRQTPPATPDLTDFHDKLRFLWDQRENIRNGDSTAIREAASATIDSIIAASRLDQIYNLVFLMQEDEASINNTTRDAIYSALSKLDASRPMLLIISSTGGEIGPAYLISKCCQEFSGRFEVAIPRQAKSAATLIALGADRLHMGTISELGPIDPQIRRLPALALGDAVKYISSLIKSYPDSSEMFASYLHRQLDLQYLGYAQRLAESAAHYATLLLAGKPIPEGSTPAAIADKLVNGYKDHGFVIDRVEAQKILGQTIVSYKTPEYNLSNHIYELIEQLRLAFWALFRNQIEAAINIVGNSSDLTLTIRHLRQ